MRDLKYIPEYKDMVKINRARAKLFVPRKGASLGTDRYEFVSTKSGVRIYQKKLMLAKIY